MAAGVPVVATAVGGIPDTVSDEANGLLVPAGRPDLAADAVLRLIREPALAKRLADNACAYVRERHARDVIAEQYVELYRRITNRSGCVDSRSLVAERT
jgi:glycosyltransferase involved in cell wall biosynthesis